MKPGLLVTLDLTTPETHRVRVRIEAAKRGSSDDLPPILTFPVWTPGSYLVREYARHVTRLEPADKISKNQWRVRGNARAVSYEVYCFERSVRTSFLDVTHAALVGATLLPLLHAPFEVELLVPRAWEGVSSALKFHRVEKGRYRATVESDDDWIDKPILAWAKGFGSQSSFRVNGITHHVAHVGGPCTRTAQELQSAFAKLCRSTMKMFGGAPFKEYWFLLHFGQKMYGGLEHRESQLSQFDGELLREPGDWNRFLKLIAHEYFHSWNVKALRPLALGPFDYTSENYTPDIWFSEGLTDYFDDIIPLQAGLYTRADHDKARLKDVSLFPDGHPGHFRRSLAESSFDAWIRYYRPDEDSVNTDVSYYGKGAVLGWCWDMHLQKRSRKRWTLGKLMKEFYQEFGVTAAEPLKTAQPGFTRTQLLEFAEKKTGIPQRALVESWVTERKPLPWREAARLSGLKWKENITSPAQHFLGFQLKWDSRGGSVASVLAGSAAEEAGVAPHDELLALNGIRISDDAKFKVALKNAMVGSRDVSLLLARAERVVMATLRFRKHEGIGVEVIPA